MTRKRFIPAAIIGVAFALTAAIILATPQRLNYQGYITQGGLPMNGPATMEFRLFSAVTGGAQLCSTNPQSVTVTRGRFSYEIGSEAGGCDLTAIDWAGSDVFLEVVVGGQTLTPRERVAPAAMSLNSDKLGGQAAAAFATAAHAHDGAYIKVSGDTMSGALTVANDVTVAGDITAATGTVTAAAFVGDGAGLTNLPVAGGDMMSDGSVPMSGALTVNNTITATGTVTAPLFDGAFSGDGSMLTFVDADSVGGQAAAAFATAAHAHDGAYIKVSGDTMSGALTAQGGIVSAGDITAATGTVTAAAFVGDGAGLTNLQVAGGDMMSDGSVPMSGALTVNNTITATGTVTAPLFDGAFSGDGSMLTFVDADSVGGQSAAAFATAAHAHDGAYIKVSGDTMSGALTVANDVTVAGDITAATGTVTAAAFVGDGAGLTNLPVAGGDFMSDGSVPMTGGLTVGANTGAAGYDVNFYGTYSALTGSRMFWDASKSAFRAGNTPGNQWDDGNVGPFSIAAGFDTIASGETAVSLGRSTIASGGYSTAIGMESTASDPNTVAIGYNAMASSLSSMALGTYTTASGDYTLAAGRWTTAGPATNAFALGSGVDNGNRMTNSAANSLGVGFNSDVPTLFVGPGSGVGTYGKVGIGTTSPATMLDLRGTFNVGLDGTSGHDVNFYGTWGSPGSRMFWDASKSAFRTGRATGAQWDDANIGPYSFAVGDNTTASGEGSTAMGNSTVSSNLASTAMGQDTTASGEGSTAMGYGTTASGLISTAMGMATTASGEGSTAMGDNTTASGDGSTAMGMVTTASGEGSTAMGLLTTASGNYSTAMGNVTTASGNYSTAMGNVTAASGDSSIAAGQYVTAGPNANTIALGTGVDDFNVMTNNTTNSLMVGFDSDVPTLFVGPAAGVGTYGNIGIRTTTPETSAALEIAGTDGALLLPRMSSAQQDALTGVNGMLIYNSETNKFRGRENGAWSDLGGGDFMADGSVPMTGGLTVGANTGADGYDVNFYGTYNGDTDSRMFWDASKSAFRAGGVDGAQWDDANVGAISFASGYDTTASGEASTAMGIETTASGQGSTAMGGITTASGNHSTSMGFQTTASGDYSTAMGETTTASGLRSTAMGSYTTASGDYSISAGQYVTAGPNAKTIALGTGVGDLNRMTNNTTNSLGIGFNSTVPTLFVGPGSGIGTYGKVGIGTSTPATTLDVQGEVTVGQATLTDIYDVTFYGAAEGVSGRKFFWNANKAALRAGTSLSYADIDTGEYSVALGRHVTASAEASVSLGYGTAASGERAVALGSMTTASGQISTAMGYNTIASGGFSTAIGDTTESAGGYSISIGSYSTTNTGYSITLGRYLESAIGSDYSITLGNGAGNATRLVNSVENSLMVGFDSDVPTLFVGPAAGVGTYGNIGIRTTTPETSAALEIAGTDGALLLPRMSSAQQDALTGVNGMLIYNSETNKFRGRENGAWSDLGGGDFMADGSVPMTGGLTVGANTGTDGYDVNFYGTYNGDTGSRLFWNTSKSAFRVGRVTGAQWDNANVGPYSFASGYDATASGHGSIATGFSSTASGLYSTAMGENTVASNDASTAMGFQTTASGFASTAMGDSTTASGDYSIAAGQYVTAGPNANTIALGKGVGDFNRMTNNTANSLGVGFNSTVPTLFVGPGSGIGTYGNVGIGTTSPATMLDLRGTLNVGLNGTSGYDVNFYGTFAGAGERMFWDASKSAFRAGGVDGAQWDDANVGPYSFATGYRTTASALDSTAMGYQTIASGMHSTAMGYNTTASGNYSTAMGYGTTASFDYAIAMGGGTTSNGLVSTAMGYGTTASGMYSTAMGAETTASGDSSIAAGQYVAAGPNANTIAIGKGVDSGNLMTNNIINSLGIGFNSTVPTLFVGPGSGAGTYGKVGIGTTGPSYMLHVNGDMGGKTLNLTNTGNAGDVLTIYGGTSGSGIEIQPSGGSTDPGLYVYNQNNARAAEIYTNNAGSSNESMFVGTNSNQASGYAMLIRHAGTGAAALRVYADNTSAAIIEGENVGGTGPLLRLRQAGADKLIVNNNGGIVTPSAPAMPEANAIYGPLVPKAWARFYGTTGAVTTVGAYNVASITSPSTGNYQVSLYRAFADTNYVVMATAEAANAETWNCYHSGGTSGAITVSCRLNGTLAANSSGIHVVVFGTQ